MARMQSLADDFFELGEEAALRAPGPRRSPRPRHGRARAPAGPAPPRCAALIACGSLRRPFSASLPSACAIESRPRCAAPGCASKSSVRTPHCASTCAMPRPMVPAPATPATRSLRETSSMEGGRYLRRTLAIIARGGGEMRDIAVAAGIALAALRARRRFAQSLPGEAGDADLPVAAGRHHRHSPAQVRRDRAEAPRPDR